MRNVNKLNINDSDIEFNEDFRHGDGSSKDEDILIKRDFRRPLGSD